VAVPQTLNGSRGQKLLSDNGGGPDFGDLQSGQWSPLGSSLSKEGVRGNRGFERLWGQMANLGPEPAGPRRVLSVNAHLSPSSSMP
jgi:hypothetical protein